MHRLLHNQHFCAWIIDNGFPTDLQLLCANCNRCKGKFGICIHKGQIDRTYSKGWRSTRKRRLRVIQHYGGKCTCCGETEWRFLEFDHVNNDGNVHRRILKHKIVKWIIDNNYPDSIQLLCSNCNKAKGLFGCCPHQTIQPPVNIENEQIRSATR